MQKKVVQFIKCPFPCWRESASSTSLSITLLVSSEQNATIITPKQDITPAAIQSPEENAVPTTAAPPDDKVDALVTRKKFWRRLLARPWLRRLKDTSTSTPSTEEVGVWLTTEELWGQLLKTSLQEKKLERLSCLLTYNCCAERISRMCTRYKGKTDTKILTAIKPVVEWLLIFNKALPLVDGITLIFFESAKSIYSVSSGIQALLDGLETMLPRLKEYVDLYSDNERLRKIFCDVCAVYVDACILTALSLERRACKNLLRELCLACRDGRRFADAIDKLEKHERAFHHEADLASARHVKDIHTAVSGRAPDLMAPDNSQSSIYEQHTQWM